MGMRGGVGRHGAPLVHYPVPRLLVAWEPGCLALPGAGWLAGCSVHTNHTNHAKLDPRKRSRGDLCNAATWGHFLPRVPTSHAVSGRWSRAERVPVTLPGFNPRRHLQACKPCSLASPHQFRSRFKVGPLPSSLHPVAVGLAPRDGKEGGKGEHAGTGDSFDWKTMTTAGIRRRCCDSSARQRQGPPDRKLVRWVCCMRAAKGMGLELGRPRPRRCSQAKQPRGTGAPSPPLGLVPEWDCTPWQPES